ncbi:MULTISPECIES: Flp pilus assembly protein CpaB [Henriciella]|uniref:Flp pilus assembly protein CpaB n=1 Tax=Henriciella TaxID=453849 RepID=UPI003512512F
MQISPVVTLILSIVFGVAAILGARFWLGSSDDETGVETVIEAPVIAREPVLVAVRDIPRGVMVDPAWFEVEERPAVEIPRGAFADRKALEATGLGRPTLIEIAAGDMMSEKLLLAEGMRASLSSRIEPGYRAYTIRMDDVSGVAGFVLPGDRVDVIFIANEGSQAMFDDQPVSSRSASSRSAIVLLQNVEVLGLDLNDDMIGNDARVFKSATLSVSLEQAQKLSVASESGTLSLALRGSADEQFMQAEAVNLDRPRTRRVASSVPRPLAPRRASSSTVEVVLGEQVTQYEVPVSQ